MKYYDFYREPCQLCISRADEGKFELIKGCGWCNDTDTHYRESCEYPGDIIEVQSGGSGYPFHDSPHPKRKYYRDGTHLELLDGSYPIDVAKIKSEVKPQIGVRVICTIVGIGLIYLAITQSLFEFSSGWFGIIQSLFIGFFGLVSIIGGPSIVSSQD
jgi:hypothetical protein